MNGFEALRDIWHVLDCPPDSLSRVDLTGTDPVLPSSFHVGAAAQATIAAAALAASELDRHRTGRTQRVAVDMRHAATEFRSEQYMRVDGDPPPDPWDAIAGTYVCGDGRWVRLHTNFPHHRDGVLRILGCDGKREAVAAALSEWRGEEFETAAAEAGLVVAMMRSFAEWDAHPQGQAVARQPLMTIERIGDAPPRSFGPGERPLSGVRVLDLTRVIAGPVCGRTLAAHGATVMRLHAPYLPAIDSLDVDTGRGKLSAFVDLREESGKERLRRLLSQAEIFVQGYRPNGLADLGFGPDQAAAIRPGIVYVSLSAYGPKGPWAERRGFDSLVQTASGMNHAEGEAAGSTKPRPLPCQALDHASGYLMAYGAVTGLIRRATEGGSWHIQVSLAQTGHWLRQLGRVAGGLACPNPSFEEVADLVEDHASGFGRLTAVRHAGRLSETPPWWELPSVPRGTHPPDWPPLSG